MWTIVTLDCCKTTAIGKSNFKGRYIFPTALAGNISENNCKYSGKTTFVKVFASCQTNMEFGPSYDTWNFSSCRAKYKTTQDLDKLNEVKKLIFTQ